MSYIWKPYFAGIGIAANLLGLINLEKRIWMYRVGIFTFSISQVISVCASILLLIFFSHTSHAQCVGFNGKVVYDGNTGDGHSIISISDGGFLLFGVSDDFGGSDDDWVLIKTDGSLQPLWSKAIGFLGTDEGGADLTLAELPNGNLVLGGFSLQPTRRAHIMMLDSEGNLIWTRQITNFYSVPREIKALPDGTYIVVGTINVPSGASEDAYVMKMNMTGDILWSHRFDSGSGNDHFYALTTAENGNLLIAGASVGFSGSHSGMVVEITQDGVVVGQHTYNEGLLTQFMDITRTIDGSYLIGAHQNSGGNSFGIVMKLNSQYEIVWQYKFHQGQKNHVADVYQLSSGDVVALYNIDNGNATNRFGIAKFDFDTGELQEVLNPSLDAAHQVRTTSQKMVHLPNNSLLSVGKSEPNMSVIGVNSCFEYDCDDAMDFTTLNSTFSKVSYSMPVFDGPGMITAEPSQLDITDVNPLFECSDCPGNISAISPTFCAGIPGLIHTDLSDIDEEVVEVDWSIEGLGNFEGDSLSLTIDSAGEYPYTLTVSTANGCSYEYEGEFTVFETNDPPELPELIGYCEGSEATLDLGPYISAFGIGVEGGPDLDGPVYTFPGSGIYTFFFESECGSYSIDVEVEEGLASISLEMPDAVCFGTEVEVLIPEWPLISVEADLTIDFGNGTVVQVNSNMMSTTYTTAGSYTVSVYGLIGECEAFAAQDILVEDDSPEFSLEPVAELCQGEIFALDFSALGFDVINAQGDVVDGFETEVSGVYSFTALGACGNVEQFVTLTVIPFNPIPVGMNFQLCPGRDTLSLSFASQQYMFLWSNGSTQPAIEVSMPGTYVVQVSDSTGACSDDYSFSVQAFALSPQEVFPDGLISVCLEGDRTIHPAFIGVPYTFPDGSVGYSFEVQESGIFELLYSDLCYEYSHQVEVELKECLCPMWVPNVFTPNSDGRNDIFLPVVDCPVENYRLEILNRWGQLVFETSDLYQGWNGSFRGGDYFCSAGQYIYLIHYEQYLNELAIPKALTGHVTLIR